MKMAFRNYILLFALVTGTIAGPINVLDGDLKCATKCEASLSDSGKFQYAVGHTYTYTYEGTTETRLHGSSDQWTNLKIQADADIEVLSQCEFALKLRDVTLVENNKASPNTDSFKRKLEAKPLRFAFQDGVIENVCSEAGEDERVLNIKRGVLSTFQNSMDQLDKDGLFTETDVSGRCPTNYVSKSGLFGGAVTVTKTKDILACTDRTGNITSIHSETYNVPSKLQNAPLLSSTHTCDQHIKSGQIQKTTCSEVLMFRPFNKDGNGAVTKATQLLTFSTYKRSVSLTETVVQRRSSMLFHHLYDQTIDVNAKTDVIDLLQKICSDVSDSIKKDTPILFGQLIQKMKKLSTDHMMQVYTAVTNGRICSTARGKQFFYDAVPVVATEASISLTKKLITENVVQGIEAEMWLTQLAFIPRPTVSMLAVVKPLIENTKYRTKALLGVSAMVNKICEHNANCNTIPEVVEFISVLNANIGSDCSSSTKEQRETILVTLKAIGNAGVAYRDSVIIGRCITNQDVATDVKVAALQAFRRMPCTISRTDAMRMYRDAQIDSELRIHAFLAVMQCPTTTVLRDVRMMLSGEPINQVGSFVWTYLENVKETSSPLRQELSSILDDAKLRQDFNLDARKYSRNLEKSFFSDYLNAGAQVESNLIWSQRSYIPRSAMVNLTVEMFGDSVNLVELGGRVQGLEKIVEKFFGPNGYFSKKNVKELMDNKRQTANYISTFDNAFKTPEDKILTSMYVKVFGNEIRFSELDSDDWMDVKNFNVLDFLIKLAEPKKVDVTKNLQIVDSSLIIPTCVGLPMNLTVDGTASLTMDIDGNVDLRQIAASPRSFDINGHIKPSASVVISGLMGVDAIVTKSTMKMVSTMHTSTHLEGKITLENGQIFNVELTTPAEKLEVFRVQTEFFMNGEEMKMPEPAKVYKKCTPAGLTKVTGMEMCFDITIPTLHQEGLPLPPLTGPANAQVFIEKKDTHTGYKFTAKFENDKQEVSGSVLTKRTIHLGFDTPGSQVDRKLLLEAVYDPIDMEARAQLMSPWKKLGWTASLENTMALKKAQSSLIMDDQTYTIDAQLATEVRTVKTVWTPSLTITIPNKPDMSISGTFETGTGKTVAALDLSVKNFVRKPITLSSHLYQTKGGSSYEFAFDVNSDLLTSKITSDLTVASGTYNGKADIEYSMMGRPNHRLTMYSKFGDKTIGDLMSYTLQAGFVPTEFPEYQFSVDSSLDMTVNHIDTTVEVEVNREKIFFHHKTTKQGTWNALIVKSESQFRYPTKSIEMSANIDHEHNADLIKQTGVYSYADDTVTTTINFDKSNSDKLVAKASYMCPHKTLSFDAEMTKITVNEHKILLATKWGTDVNSQASLTSTWKSGETHEITGDFKIPHHPFTILVSVKPNAMDFMGRVDVTNTAETLSFQSEYKVEATRLTSSASFKCDHHDMSYKLDLSSINGKMAVNTEVSWETAKKMSLTGEYNIRDTSSMVSRDGTLTIVSPFGTQSFNSEVEWSTSKNGRMSSELLFNGKKSTMTARYNLGTGEFTLSSPFIKYGEVESINIDFTHTMTTASTTITWAPTKKVTGEVAWTDTKYNVDVTTPFWLTKFGGHVELPTPRSVSTRVYWNDKQATFVASNPDKSKAEFTLVYPEHTVTGTYNFDDNSEWFTQEAEVTYDDKKIWAKRTHSWTSARSWVYDMTTPFEGMKKLSSKIELDGELKKWTMDGTFALNEESVQTTVSYTHGQDGKFSAQTPWADLSGEYLFNGNKESFNTNANFKWADDKEITADLTFNMLSGLKTTFTLKTPFYTPISGSLEHTGTMEEFNNVATFTWAPTKTLTATTSFSKRNNGAFNVNVVAPEQAKFTITHSGHWAKWSNNMELTLKDKTPMTVYSEFNQEQWDAKIGFRAIPHEKIQNGEWSMDGTVYNDKLELVSTLKWNTDKSIITRMMLSRENGYSASASIVSPFMETMTMQMEYKQSTNVIDSSASFQWASDKTISSELYLSRGSGITMTAKMISPWRPLTFSYNQHGDSSEFLASTEMSWATDKMAKATLEFSRIEEVTLKLDVTTPFTMAKEVKAVLTHTGKTFKNFNNQLELTYNGKDAKLSTIFEMQPTSTELKLLTVNPWKNFNTVMKLDGVFDDFTTFASFNMDDKTYSVNTKFVLKDTLTLNFDVTPVIYKPVFFTSQFGGAMNTATLRWGDNKVISGTASLTANDAFDSVNALIKFNTPFEGYTSGEATIKHTGMWQAFREIVEVSFNTKSARLTGGFSSTRDIKGDFTLTSSWYNADGSFEHSGNMQRFSNSMQLTYLSGKTVRATSKWDMTDGIDTEVTFNSPIKTFDAKYKHQFSLTKVLTAHAEATVDSKRMLNADLTFKNVPSDVKLEFSVENPIKSFSGKYTHIGQRTTRCNAEVEFTWDTQTVAADWTISMISGFTTTVNVRSPWRNLAGEIKHIKTDDSFENTLSATYETGKTITLVTEFSMRPEFLIKSRLTSPLKNANIEYRHSGNWENFNCHMEGAYGEMPVVANMAWSTVSKYSTSFDLTSPWKNLKGSFMTNTDLLDLESTADFEWETGKSITLSVTNKNRIGDFVVRTPWRTVSANYECQGPWENFDGTVEFSWETGKKITVYTKADRTSGIDAEWKLTTPWRMMSHTFKYTPDYNMDTTFSWELGKSVSAEVKNTMTETLIDSSIEVKSPWRDMSTSFRLSGTKSKFDATTKFSWETGKNVEMHTTWDMETDMSASSTLTTPWRTMSAKFDQSGDMMKFNGDYEISWETGKKITTSVFLNRENGWESKIKIVSPWKTIETNMMYTGAPTDFRSTFDFSWELNKKVSLTASFSLEPFAASWSYECPNSKYTAEVKHDGTLTDFTNSASITWGPAKKIEFASSFKMTDNIVGSATLKSPFYTDVDISFEHTPTTGEVTIVTPFTERVEVTYRYTNRYNFNVDAKYGTIEYNVELITTMNNGLQTLIKLTAPEITCSLDVDHQGDYFTFLNTVEAKWKDQTYKLVTSSDKDKWTFSQTLETPFIGYKSLSWSLSVNPVPDSFEVHVTLRKMTNTIEFNFNRKVEKRPYKTIVTSMLELNTPFEGYEKNKFNDMMEYSSRLFHWKTDGYVGSPSEAKFFEVYGLMTGMTASPTFESWMKTDLKSEEESELKFKFALENGHITSEFKSDVKFWPAVFNMRAILDVTHTQTDSEMTHVASLDLSDFQGMKKFTWNFGSNANMLEAGFGYIFDGTDVITYTEKITWTSEFETFKHDMSLKVPHMDMLKDCEVKMEWDLSQPTKTFSLTGFNNPTAPYDLKVEVLKADTEKLMIELVTPLEAVKHYKLTIEEQDTTQPWTLKVTSELNNKPMTFDTSVSYTSPMVFDFSASFTSQLPMYEKLDMSLSSTSTAEQWKPHASFQWAADKKMDIGATISWSSQYKATFEFSSPFENWRSVSMDATVDNEWPSKLTCSFELSATMLTSQITSHLAYDMTAKSFSFTLNTPFETMQSFEVSAAMKPRINAFIKHNGQTLFSLTGNAQLDSLTKHDIDLTATYPFFTQYFRIKVNNDLDITTDNEMRSLIDIEYMRGKEVSWKFHFVSAASSTLVVSLETPFEKFEKTSYSLAYSGNPQSWSETTAMECYYGKVTTRTSFSMTDGLQYHQTITGEMKNGFDDFNLQKDFVFTGDANKFDLQATMVGSMVPTIKFETAWEYNPVILNLKASLNKYSIEYKHTGPRTDFTCNWKLAFPTSTNSWFGTDSVVNEYIGTWSFKMADELMLSADITCPHDTQFKFNFQADMMKGSWETTFIRPEGTLTYSTSYSRSATPFKYEGSISVDDGDHKFVTSVDLTENSIDFPMSYDDKEFFAIRASNKMNADDEYEPIINAVLGEETYEFDGLFKNEGSGFVRDFKLHMIGPKGKPGHVNFQFDFETQSEQLVPGHMKVILNGQWADGYEWKALDMTANWGNDNAVITFVEPQPMRYSMDFSVTTTGQTVALEANWDTTAIDKKIKIDLNNKFASSSRRLTSTIDIDVIYTGISRGFTSNLDLQEDSYTHRLTLDYNGKEIGYDLSLSQSTGMSLELITEWRNVKVTWNNQTPSSDVVVMTLGFFWDSSRDLSKRFLGTSRWENTGYNSYKWTSTFMHPYLTKEIVITDVVSYNTSRNHFALNKKISYSTDTAKDMIFDVVFEKSGKWGVEVRQDFNKIDIRFGSEFTSNGMVSTALYKAANGARKEFSLITNFAPSGKAGSIEVITPMKTVKVQMTSTDTTAMVTLTVDGKVYTTSFAMRPEDYYMRLEMVGDATKVEFEAKQLTGGYQVHLFTTKDGKDTTEGLAAISMNESKTINGKLYWNPTLISEIQTKIAALRTTLKDTVKQMSTAAHTEVKTKANSMNIGGDFADIMPKHKVEHDLFMSDVAAAKVMLKRGYNDDVFFMKTVDETIGVYMPWIQEKMTAMMTAISECYERDIQRLHAMVQYVDQVWLEKIRVAHEDMKTKLHTFMTTHGSCITRKWEKVSAWLQVHTKYVTDFIATHPTMETLRGVHTAIMTRFTTFTNGIYDRIIIVADPQVYTDIVYSTHSFVNRAIMSSPLASPALTGLSDSFMYKLKFYYNYYDISDNIKMFLTHANNVAKEYMNDYLTHYIDQTLDSFKWVKYDLPTGRIEAEFTIPSTLNKINMLTIRANLKQKYHELMAYAKKCHFNIREMVSMYTPMQFNQVLPPFDVQGIISGQHIRTFDRRHYDFSSGKCSYLLARDFHDGNFTIFVNYNGEEQSLTVHSNGKTVDIHQDYSVKLDGSKIELPHQFFNTSIIRMGSKIVVTSTLGVKVICDNMHGICTVEMSGYYYAKTGGLFGTYNYEPADDFTTSANTNVSDIATFANTWTSSCVGTNTAKEFPTVQNTKEYKACAAMFLSESSPLAACFDTVKPQEAFHNCIIDMSTDVTLTSSNGPCKAAMYYIAECKFAGVEMEEPSQCVSCQVGASSIQFGNSMQLNHPVMAADVIFVVEEKMCNYEIDTKLPSLAKLIESSLGANSFSDVRFGLVGFGGEGVHSPSHIHTMDSKMLAARTELSLGTAALKFSTLGSNKDVFDAVDFAAQYPFRAGASKVIIVLPCSDCSESKMSFQSLVERVHSEDIAVHVINNFEYEVTSEKANPPTNYIFGIDNSAVYTARDMRALKGTVKLFDKVTKPTDSCSNLALKTGGTVFNVNMMTKMRAIVTKGFQTVFANRLALTTSPSRCLSCTCEYSPLMMMSRTACKKC